MTGLDWSDLDYKAKTLNITKARQYTAKLGTYDKKPKTKKSIRTVSMSDDCIYVLEEHKKEQDNQRAILGDKWVESGKIFVQQNGQPMFPETPSSWFSKWIKRKGLPDVDFHGLRHSHASILISQGVDIVTVSRRLGHNDVRTTMAIYAHAYEQNDSKIADLLDDVLSPEMKPHEFKIVK